MLEKRLREETPEFSALAIDYSQLEKDFGQRRKAANQRVMIRLGEMMRSAPHGIEHAFIIFTRTIDGSHDGLVALYQQRRVHARLKVEGADSIVPRSVLTQQPSFALEPLPELCIGKGIQQPHHGEGNSAAANEIDLAFENVDRIVVKAYNETGHDFDSVVLDL